MSHDESETIETDVESSDPKYGRTAFTNALALGTFAVGTALVLGLTYSGTKDRITESQRIAEEKALLEVIGDTAFDNDLLEDLIPLGSEQSNILNIENGSHARAVRSQGQVQGFIFPAVAPDGYSGKIHLLVGIDVDGALMGVRVVDHKETPGLGDKIDTKKSSWILEFAGKSLKTPSKERWAVKKDGGDFDAFTGATITPRAVVNMVKTALELSGTDMQLLIETAMEVQTHSSEALQDG